jgi:hypothetical protein
MKSQHTGAVTEEKGEAYFLAPVNSRLAAQQHRCESIQVILKYSYHCPVNQVCKGKQGTVRFGMIFEQCL